MNSVINTLLALFISPIHFTLFIFRKPHSHGGVIAIVNARRLIFAD